MKTKKKKWGKILIIVFVIVLIIGISILLLVNNVSGKINGIGDVEISMFVEEYTVRKENITTYVKGTGEITSFNIQTLDIPSFSTIKETYVNDGDRVSTKQKILKINADGITKDITSPIDGMYFETENIGTKIYQVYDLNNIGVSMYVSENDVANLVVGQKAIVKITALKKEVEGTISYISKLPIDGKFKVKVKIDYIDEIRFGYGTSVKIIVEEKENALVIPYNVLEMDNDEKYYVVKKGFEKEFYNYKFNGTPLPDFAKTYIEIGTIANNQVEVLSGLNSDDIILELN